MSGKGNKGETEASREKAWGAKKQDQQQWWRQYRRCEQFETKGRCTYGYRCKFHQAVPCKYFQEGRCAYGRKCLNLHVPREKQRDTGRHKNNTQEADRSDTGGSEGRALVTREEKRGFAQAAVKEEQLSEDEGAEREAGESTELGERGRKKRSPKTDRKKRKKSRKRDKTRNRRSETRGRSADGSQRKGKQKKRRREDESPDPGDPKDDRRRTAEEMLEDACCGSTAPGMEKQQLAICTVPSGQFEQIMDTMRNRIGARTAREDELAAQGQQKQQEGKATLNKGKDSQDEEKKARSDRKPIWAPI